MYDISSLPSHSPYGGRLKSYYVKLYNNLNALCAFYDFLSFLRTFAFIIFDFFFEGLIREEKGDNIMQVSLLNMVQNLGVNDKVIDSAISNKSFQDYLSSFKSLKANKVNDIQKNSMNELKDLMKCQISVHNLAMKVELVSRVAEAGVGSVRKLQNGI